MSNLDEIAAVNQRHWESAVTRAVGFTLPWLDLDPAMLRLYANGELETVPEWLDGIYPHYVLAEAEGKDMLCLAAGGGQQSAVFGLLGARLTVLDLTEGQLDGDRKAADHYGYDVTTLQGDMRDLERLVDQSFDLVYQGNSMSWVPDVRQVYLEVVRVLRTGGTYRVDFANPATEFVDWDSSDAAGYRITAPYAETERIEQSDGSAPGSFQFRHHMRDIFNGLLELGMSIRTVQDSPHYFRQDTEVHPGSWDHWQRYVGGFAIVAKRG